MSDTVEQAAGVRAIAEILKKRFPNLSTMETVDLAFDILRAVDKAREEKR